MRPAQNNQQTVHSLPSLPPDSRTNFEKKMDAENGKTWADGHAAEVFETQNLSEDFDPSSILRKLMQEDDEHGDRPEPQEDGVPLNDGALRILKLAQGE